MSGLDAGLLDVEITLQTATRSRDATTGEEVLTWADADTFFAEWLPGTATEVWKSRQIDATIEGAFRIYYRDDVVPDLSRIVDDDGRIFDVLGVIQPDRQISLVVNVKAHGEAA